MTNQLIPYRDPKALAQLLKQPAVKIAELVTGALAGGVPGAMMVGGRIIQGALKGNLMKQVSVEIQQLIKKGRIKEDYVDSKYGFQTLAELLAFIDSEVPDEDRLRAVKSLFYSIVDKDAQSGSEILRYELFKIATRLNSSQLLTLRAAYQMRKGNRKPTDADSWRKEAARQVGHNSVGLVANDEETLVKEKLIGETTYADHSGIKDSENSRLTDLGISLVEIILQYENFSEK